MVYSSCSISHILLSCCGAGRSSAVFFFLVLSSSLVVIACCRRSCFAFEATAKRPVGFLRSDDRAFSSFSAAGCWRRESSTRTTIAWSALQSATDKAAAAAAGNRRNGTTDGLVNKKQSRRVGKMADATIIRDVKRCQTLAQLKDLLLRRQHNKNNSNDDDNKISILLKNPNVAAAGLKRTTQLVSKLRISERNQKKNRTTKNHQIIAAATERDLQLAKHELLPTCLKPIVSSLVDYGSAKGANATPLNVQSTAECLISLSILLSSTKGESSSSSSSYLSFEKTAPVLLLLFGRLEDLEEGNADAVISQLSPIKLVQCLMAVRPFSDAIMSDLYSRMCLYLCQGHVLSQINFPGLLTIFRAVPLDGPVAIQTLLRCVARRVCRLKVRQAASTKQKVLALRSTCKLWSYPLLNREDDCYVQSVRKEIRRMAYKLSKDIINQEEVGMKNSTLITDSVGSTLCQTARGVLKTSATDPFIQSLFCGLENGLRNNNATVVSTRNSAVIFSAIEHWQLRNQSIVVEALGKGFNACVTRDTRTLVPRDVNTILRCVGLLYSHDKRAMDPFLVAARSLFVDPSFLQRCGVLELSNFVWFAAFKTRNSWADDDELLHCLAQRVLDPDIVEACTPKLACRFLNSFVSLCTPHSTLCDKSAPRCFVLLSDLFGSLGEHLLSTQLSPLDASSAISSYAKASYAFDMGIFDHLVEVLSSQVSDCSVRQVAQSLWACGKMMAWENEKDVDASTVEPDESTGPPFFSGALELTTYLVRHADILSTKDVTQTVWAMARLRLNDQKLLEPVVLQARILASDLNIQETANLIWALGKLGSSDSATVFSLTRRFTDPEFTRLKESGIDIKPLEASSILYALGLLNIRDEEVFRNLSELIIEQIESVNAEVVACVLTAHRAVLLEPPQQLLDRWANQKLGIVTVSKSEPNPDYF